MDQGQTTNGIQLLTGETVVVGETDFLSMLNERLDSILSRVTASMA